MPFVEEIVSYERAEDTSANDLCEALKAAVVELGGLKEDRRQEAIGKHQQKEKTAKKLLAKGYPPGEIAEIVELDEEEIRKLLH